MIAIIVARGKVRHGCRWWCLRFFSWRRAHALTADVDALPTPVETGEGEIAPPPDGGVAAGPDRDMESRQIVIWAPEFWAPSDETPSGQVVNSAITQFEQANTGIKVEVQTKAEAGEAGIFNYLRSAQKVAPAVLPDAVFLDTQDLWRLVELGMVQPLTDTVALRPERFYPFALSAARVGDELFGIPYASDIVHAAAFGVSGQTIPANWSDLRADGRGYLFPTVGPDRRHVIASPVHWFGRYIVGRRA